jgi:hypothetical protein
MKGIDWSSLWKKEDWLAVWQGFLIMALVVVGLTLVIPSFRWVTDGELRGIIAEKANTIAQITKDAEAMGEAALLTEMLTLQAAIVKQDRLSNRYHCLALKPLCARQLAG